jgi:hypothetical protein
MVYDCPGRGRQAMTEELNQGQCSIFPQESQNRQSLVIDQAFYILTQIINTACLLGNGYTAYSLFILLSKQSPKVLTMSFNFANVKAHAEASHR